MYQGSLFESLTHGAKHLGSGMMASVHELPDGWVLKRSHTKDGTLRWLEFCRGMQDAGKHMPGMPEIDRLAHTEDGYVCTMRKYTGLTDAQREEFRDMEAVKVPHIAALLAAYLEYAKVNFCAEYHSVWWLWDDLHYGNVMYDSAGTLVITDPCCVGYEYFEPAEPSTLVLH